MLTRLSSTDEVAQYGAALNFVDVLLIPAASSCSGLYFLRLPASRRIRGDAEETFRDALHVFSAVLIPRRRWGGTPVLSRLVALVPERRIR